MKEPIWVFHMDPLNKIKMEILVPGCIYRIGAYDGWVTVLGDNERCDIWGNVLDTLTMHLKTLVTGNMNINCGDGK